MKLHKYTVKPYEIEIFHNRNLQVAAWALLITLSVLVALPIVLMSITYSGGEQGFSLNQLWGFSPFLLLLPFFYAGYKSTIINLNSGDVYRKSMLGKRKLINLKDVSRIVPVGGSSGIYYKLFSKNDPHGKGIRISGYYATRHHKAESLFSNEVAVPIENKLTGNTQTTPAPIVDYKYYHIENSRYTVKSNWWTWGISFIIVLTLAIVLMFGGSHIETSLKIIPFFPLTLLFVMLTKKLIFDTKTKTLTVSYVWIFKKTYDLNKFIRFCIVRESVNGMYEGTAVKMEFQAEKGVKDIELVKYRKTKHIEPFLEETRSILPLQ